MKPKTENRSQIVLESVFYIKFVGTSRNVQVYSWRIQELFIGGRGEYNNNEFYDIHTKKKKAKGGGLNPKNMPLVTPLGILIGEGPRDGWSILYYEW